MASNRLRLKPHDQQVMVITGATSGIGLALAREAAARGTAVFLIARNPEALEEVARELADRGARAAYHAADVGVETEVRAAAGEALKLFGGWDVWVNDAGVSIFGPVRETPLEDHKRLFDTNYWGVVHGSLVAVEHLRKRPGGGVLINVGSVLGDMPIPVQGAYAASKSAVKGFTEALRMELLREGAPVAVTLIKPSAIATPYKDHAKNLTETAVKNPPPVYDPKLVAEAILYATRHRVREMTVGFAGRALTVFHNMVPAAAEPLFARVFPALQRDRAAPRRRTEDSLYEHGRDLAVASDYARVRKISLFTKVQMHPLATIGVFLAAGAVGGAMGVLVNSAKARAAAQALAEARLTRAAPPRPSLAAKPLAGPKPLRAAMLRGSSALRVRPAVRSAPALLPGALAALAATAASGAVVGVRRLRRRKLNGHHPPSGKRARVKGWVELRH
jgi:short-subunit dehydrogenase